MAFLSANPSILIART